MSASIAANRVPLPQAKSTVLCCFAHRHRGRTSPHLRSASSVQASGSYRSCSYRPGEKSAVRRLIAHDPVEQRARVVRTHVGVGLGYALRFGGEVMNRARSSPASFAVSSMAVDAVLHTARLHSMGRTVTVELSHASHDAIFSHSPVKSADPPNNVISDIVLCPGGWSLSVPKVAHPSAISVMPASPIACDALVQPMAAFIIRFMGSRLFATVQPSACLLSVCLSLSSPKWRLSSGSSPSARRW